MIALFSNICFKGMLNTFGTVFCNEMCWPVLMNFFCVDQKLITLAVDERMILNFVSCFAPSVVCHLEAL